MLIGQNFKGYFDVRTFGEDFDGELTLPPNGLHPDICDKIGLVFLLPARRRAAVC
jgi:hypothetical protein